MSQTELTPQPHHSPTTAEDEDASFGRASRHWWQWLLMIVVGLLVLVAALVPLGLWWLAETASGRAFVARQISGLEPESGLTFEVGQIDGSLLSQFEMTDIVVRDLDGDLALIPRASVDWSPITLISSLVSINSLDIPHPQQSCFGNL